MEGQKHGAATLAKKFFNASSQEIMALPGEDRVALGSAIARQEGLKPEDLAFTPVEY